MDVMRILLICCLTISLTDGHKRSRSSKTTDDDDSSSSRQTERNEKTETVCCDKPVPADLVSNRTVILDRRLIKGDCSAEVNRCPVGSCVMSVDVEKEIKRSKTTIKICPVYGVIKSITNDLKVDCGVLNPTDNVQQVVNCVCEMDRGIEVIVTVVDHVTEMPLSELTVEINKIQVDVSESKGVFLAMVSPQSEKLVIYVKDNDGNYITTVKVQPIPLSFRGPVTCTVRLVKVANPTATFSSTDAKELKVMGDQPNSVVNIAVLKIPKNAFSYPDGTPYTGTVNAGFYYIDVSNPENEEIIPGRFLTSATPLVSGGIFAASFKDPSGELLTAEDINLRLQNGMEPWELNVTNGGWSRIGKTSKKSNRPKRQQSDSSFIVTIQSLQWVNCDQIPTAPDCYFKARVFEPNWGSEITTSATTSFLPNVVGYLDTSTPARRLGMYPPSTMTPGTTCSPIRCPVLTHLRGFINLVSYEYVSVGTSTIPFISSLEPKEFTQYTVPIQGALTTVVYGKVDTIYALVNFTLSAAGPFYANLADCEDSTIADPAFHFTKQQVPYYEPFPADTAICTARVNITLTGATTYISQLAMLAPPNVTAVSVWQHDGQNFNYYTDNKVFVIVNETSYSICIKYRCSNDSYPTTVYLSVNAPTTYNAATDETTPAFICRSKCDGRLCNSDEQVNGFPSSFMPPSEVNNDGPRYFLDVDECTNETNTAEFAARFYCFSKSQGSDRTTGAIGRR